jgi:hypothetical protein
MVHLWWKKAGHLCTCIVSEAGMQQLSRQVQCHPHCDALTLLHLPLGEHGAFLTRAEGCCSSADALSQRSKPSQCRSSPISSVLARAKHILQVGNQRGQGDIHVHALTLQKLHLHVHGLSRSDPHAQRGSGPHACLTSMAMLRMQPRAHGPERSAP